MSIKLWDPSKHYELKMETAHHAGIVNQVLTYEDTLITCSHDKAIKVGSAFVFASSSSSC